MSDHLLNPHTNSQPIHKRLWAFVGMVVFGAVLAVLVSQLIDRVPDRRTARFAVVDLSAVVRKNQEATVTLLASGGADQRARDAALASARGFGKRLDAEVVALSKECGCVLIMREAVVAGEVEDLTPALLSRLTKQ